MYHVGSGVGCAVQVGGVFFWVLFGILSFWFSGFCFGFGLGFLLLGGVF